MEARYRRVPTSENAGRAGSSSSSSSSSSSGSGSRSGSSGAGGGGGGGTASRSKQRSEFVDKLLSKLHALAWIGGSVWLCLWLGIPVRVLADSRLYLPAFAVGVACFVANTIIAVYLTLWMPYFVQTEEERQLPWEVYCPRMIPTATALGVVCGISWVVAFWPLWGVTAPLVLGTLFVGMISITHFIPLPETNQLTRSEYEALSSRRDEPAGGAAPGAAGGQPQRQRGEEDADELDDGLTE